MNRYWVFGGIPRRFSFPRSAWERTSGRSAARFSPNRWGLAAERRKIAFPRGAWERELPTESAHALGYDPGREIV